MNKSDILNEMVRFRNEATRRQVITNTEGTEVISIEDKFISPEAEEYYAGLQDLLQWAVELDREDRVKMELSRSTKTLAELWQENVAEWGNPYETSRARVGQSPNSTVDRRNKIVYTDCRDE